MSVRATIKYSKSEDLLRSFYRDSHATGDTQSEPLRSDAGHLTGAASHMLEAVRTHLAEIKVKDPSSSLDQEQLKTLLLELEQREQQPLTEGERAYVLDTLRHSFRDYDILTSLVEREEVNDIICSAYDNVSIQCGRQNIKTDLQFPSRDSYKNFLEKLLGDCGLACTTATPMINAAVDPNVRACVVHESLCPAGTGPHLTLRIARHKDIQIRELIEHGLAPESVLNYLGELVRSGETTMLIAGEVGTGKTTLVRALAARIAEEDAILVIEDTHELVLKREFVRTILTREANTEGTGVITPANAIRTAMRMAMNRIILGEMRDAAAAEAFIDVCASGHPGMSTIHSRSAKDAISRLELFLSRAQRDVGIETVRRQIVNAVSVVVFLGVERATRTRRIMEIYEIHHASDGLVQMAPLYLFQPGNHIATWKRGEAITRYEEILAQAGIALPRPGSIITLDPMLAYRSLH